MSNSFEFGDEVPEIQLKFRESVDIGHNIDRISKYILSIDEISFKEDWPNYVFYLPISTEKFRKYKETFKFEVEDEHVRFSDKKYNQNSLSDIYKNNDKNSYFLESVFGITKNNNIGNSIKIHDFELFNEKNNNITLDLLAKQINNSNNEIVDLFPFGYELELYEQDDLNFNDDNDYLQFDDDGDYIDIVGNFNSDSSVYEDNSFFENIDSDFTYEDFEENEDMVPDYDPNLIENISNISDNKDIYLQIEHDN